jgi:3-hydroxy acid dehydrogenase / malonic semialdehyde reductase
MSLIGRSLENEVAYITGASSGIGAATAVALAELGATVVLGARRVERLQEVEARIAARAPQARTAILPLDVTDHASVDAFLKGADVRAGPPTILVDNAGIAKGNARVAEADLEQWDEMIDVNVRAAFAVARKVLPGMLERGRGDLVFMASVAGREPYAGGSVYSATKAALKAFARSLRVEMLGKPIRVLVMDPGMVETEFSAVRFGGDVARAKAVYAGMRPLSADDVADCVAFALTRPLHMSVDEMLILSADQTGTQQVHRRDAP